MKASPRHRHSINSLAVETGQTIRPALSPAQLRIVELAARGKADKQIAVELGMAWGTTRTHWQRVFRKLQVHTRAEAVFSWALSRTAAPVLQMPVNKLPDTTAQAGRRKVKP